MKFDQMAPPSILPSMREFSFFQRAIARFLEWNFPIRTLRKNLNPFASFRVRISMKIPYFLYFLLKSISLEEESNRNKLWEECFYKRCKTLQKCAFRIPSFVHAIYQTKLVHFCFIAGKTGSGSLPASPADSGVSDVESSTSSGGNEDANLLLKARLNPNSSLQPSLASHHSHLSSGKHTA